MFLARRFEVELFRKLTFTVTRQFQRRISQTVFHGSHSQLFNPGSTLRLLTMSCMTFSQVSFCSTKDKGQIQLIFGPMFSGKSTELMRRIRRYQIANRECLVIKYAKDTRYSDDCVSTHDKQVIPAIKATCLTNIKSVFQFSVIGVDEGQFFEDIVPFCESMANKGKIVIVAALDGTFERRPFASILDLVPLAESVVKLSAVCNTCYQEAAFTKRIGQEKEIEVIGGSDKYLAVCRNCYHASQTNGKNKAILKSSIASQRTPLSPVNVNRFQH